LNVLDRLGVDTLIPIGGDDTLSYAHRMHKEGVKVVAVPKTMDNDVHGTDYCIGFSTAVTRSVEYITQLRTSVGSHERIGVIELFGRNSGETSLMAAYLAEVDRAIISEVPFDPDRLARLLAEDQERSPSYYAIMTISEGARMIGGEILESGPADAYGHRKLGGIGHVTADEVKRRTGRNIIYQQLGYLMRSGAPDSLDRMVSANYGSLAIDLIQKEMTGRLVVLKEGRYSHEDLDIVAQGVKRVDVDTFYDIQSYAPKVSEVMGKPMFLY
jgi:6-phosphofructokinase 1